MRITRILTYVGTPEWVQKTMDRNGIQEGPLGRYHCEKGSVTETVRLNEADEAALMHQSVDLLMGDPENIKKLQLALLESKARNEQAICVYCQTHHPSSEIRDHILTCEKHPMRQLSFLIEAAQTVVDLWEGGDTFTHQNEAALRLREALKKIDEVQKVDGQAQC